MDPKSWLHQLATSMPGDATQAAKRARSLTVYAPQLGQAFSPRALTPQSANAIAGKLVGFPTFREIEAALRQLPDTATRDESDPEEIEAERFLNLFQDRLSRGVPIERLLSMAKAHYPLRAQQKILAQYGPTPEQQKQAEERKDRDNWKRHVERVAAIGNPTLRWRDAKMHHDFLHEPKRVWRPWAIEAFARIMEQAAAEGADTGPYIPPQNRRPGAYAMPGMPQSAQAPHQQAPRPQASHLSPERQLAEFERIVREGGPGAGAAKLRVEALTLKLASQRAGVVA